MKKPSILEIRFNKALINQKKLTHSELQREVSLADNIGPDKFKRDCYSVYLKNNGINKKRCSYERFVKGV